MQRFLQDCACIPILRSSSLTLACSSPAKNIKSAHVIIGISLRHSIPNECSTFYVQKQVMTFQSVWMLLVIMDHWDLSLKLRTSHLKTPIWSASSVVPMGRIMLLVTCSTGGKKFNWCTLNVTGSFVFFNSERAASFQTIFYSFLPPGWMWLWKHSIWCGGLVSITKATRKSLFQKVKLKEGSSCRSL